MPTKIPGQAEITNYEAYRRTQTSSNTNSNLFQNFIRATCDLAANICCWHSSIGETDIGGQPNHLSNSSATNPAQQGPSPRLEFEPPRALRSISSSSAQPPTQQRAPTSAPTACPSNYVPTSLPTSAQLAPPPEPPVSAEDAANAFLNALCEARTIVKERTVSSLPLNVDLADRAIEAIASCSQLIAELAPQCEELLTSVKNLPKEIGTINTHPNNFYAYEQLKVLAPALNESKLFLQALGIEPEGKIPEAETLRAIPSAVKDYAYFINSNSHTDIQKASQIFTHEDSLGNPMLTWEVGNTDWDIVMAKLDRLSMLLDLSDSAEVQEIRESVIRCLDRQDEMIRHELRYDESGNLEDSSRVGMTMLNLALAKGYTDTFSGGTQKNDTGINYLNMAAKLLGLGANPNIAECSKGNTALHIACARRDTQAVQLLMWNGADPTLRNSDGERPIDMLNKSYEEASDLMKFLTSPDSHPMTFDLPERGFNKSNIHLISTLLNHAAKTA